MKLCEYETIFIVRPDVGDDVISSTTERMKGIIVGQGGTMLREQNWGKKKLAYEIKKHLKGFFVYLQYVGGGGLVQEVERNLKTLENVIKFQTVKISEKVDLEKRLEEIKQENEAAQRAPIEPASSAVSDENGLSDESGDLEGEGIENEDSEDDAADSK